MKKIQSFIIGILLFVAVVGFVPGRVSAEINHGVLGLYGCMPDEIAATLLESGAFSISGSYVILCVEGYKAVYKDLP
ncbi:hypothetical protein A2954_00900 [Candidatus Roizmanbacteria bacterium RIFCSPLOWO2_01_FULL_37_12]|uniref:Uncharacterized protein n=1 Tax=Candidatus Roizmanbacteria bacterium RIFCSPLOWO2_01_FULL_37_12 TaxID=1802056 RepID=A0A1F7IGA2_9BACT|nr:MAG: hypothetical protein A3D76_06900 [Candidatus Roizmanbacteria bacterium RIFCSPHIGHO2_02_FULL_37_9b]OGK42386.1 MAG: hypothetical protein A2954_00900 [Candidatus Roizmanbacteria bacterium RIFCSPLOWO2_01_FULL_37_12]